MAFKFAKNIKFRTKDRNVPKLCSTSEEGTGNNPAWYKKIDSLFKLATQVSQYHTKGMIHKLVPIEGSNVSNYYAPSDLYSVNPEGVTILYTVPTAGELIDANSPLNKAMLNFFNAVRGKYVNTVPFQSNDLGAYTIAVGSIITLASHIRKCLEIINLYEPDSVLTPVVMFKALGLNYRSETAAYANNVMEFDLAIRRLSSLTIPQSVTYFEKCAWQCRYVYREDNGPNSRSDLYTMVPASLLTWSNDVSTIDQGSSVKATGLVSVPFYSGSINRMILDLNLLIDRLVNDDNVRNISGWLRQYLPDNVVFANDVINSGFEVPAYSEEFKWQIINARTGYNLIYGEAVTIPGWSTGYVYAAQNIEKQILEDISTIDTSVADDSGRALFTNDAILNHHKEMTSDEVMEYTRYTPLAVKVGSNGFKYSGDTFFIKEIKKFYNVYQDGIASDNVEEAHWSQFSNPRDKMFDFASAVAMKATSHMYPVLYVVEANEEDNQLTGAYAYIYDSKFSFKISGDNLRKLHQVAVLSEFHTEYPNKI